MVFIAIIPLLVCSAFVLQSAALLPPKPHVNLPHLQPFILKTTVKPPCFACCLTVKPPCFACCLTRSKIGDNDDDDGGELSDVDDETIIIRGGTNDNFSPEFWDEIEEGQPPQWMVMQQLLGINIFTYILAAAIAFFLGMNFFLGPGWLGNMMGIPGTGTFTQVSDSLPSTIDLSNPDYLL